MLFNPFISFSWMQGGHFSGIYRKVQLKPLKWVKVPKSNGEGEEERPVEALMVLKYGGVLTHAGRKQVLIFITHRFGSLFTFIFAYVIEMQGLLRSMLCKICNTFHQVTFTFLFLLIFLILFSFCNCCAGRRIG